MRKMFWLIVIGLIGGGAYFATHELERRRLLKTLNETLSIQDPASRKALAAALAESALKTLDKPNVYAFISSQSVRQLQAKFGDMTDATPSIGELQSLKLTPRSVDLEEGAIAVAIDFEGTLRTVPVVRQKAICMPSARTQATRIDR